ncbi:MAG: hypothetical protein EWV85_17075 [Microcystis aeruginosa Ma_QC_C_20070703_M131]|uniref:Uncharacterized protein n=1 Tax=Microcystis aeruginosa Ma_QC_C_20070703_M131 TaxID=2486263 RepID=A0A551XKU6_MICAE|nr:MAG: hypothetical protein EWV85_17075 [Microcystis aeruginosa Ma_QC_C_20070703_M131]
MGCGFGTFLAKKVPEIKVEKSLRETQNPCTFRRQLQRVLLPSARGHSVILTSPTDDRRPAPDS